MCSENDINNSCRQQKQQQHLKQLNGEQAPFACAQVYMYRYMRGHYCYCVNIIVVVVFNETANRESVYAYRLSIFFYWGLKQY